MGYMVDRVHRELLDEDISRIARTYHVWRGERDAGAYKDIPGFCKSAATEEIGAHGYILTPGRYVGAAETEEEDEPFEEKMKRLVKGLEDDFDRSGRLAREILAALKAFK
jgi:type I restriction enzyme M protein